ncbi:MAG: hypothetical protein RLY58_1773 [Pseudomonadota bacterium]
MLNLAFLVAPADLVPYLDHPQLCLLDLGRASVFRQVHIRGARWLDGKRLMSGDPDAVGTLPALADLTAICEQLGLHPDQSIVVYDDEGGGWAGRMIWTLHGLGFTRVSLLDGGIHAWLADGLPTDEGEPPLITPTTLRLPTAHAQPQVGIDHTELLALLDSPNLTLWDCRSAEEYSGDRLAARRGGHIPRAIHYEWTQAMDRQNGLRLRPLDQIRQELSERGIMAAKTTPDAGAATLVTYCQSHHRSGFSYVLGHLLGLPIRAYAGGWNEWGNRRDTPITLGEHP